ncbi:uncharacterized protein BX664DRAFT_386864 [Halteromyces radiatus]|uniref:uncharacterized protein n=1 Tax=Halteromyces radiatus TaxID=101107 RepID=UPI00221F52DC|nr:uncharacterized protein BX664DRAFT_386864 [Halteromyces radiatus]KAI8086450.1 hypothetical protein BX664DRAFT_386864 [Halteromyces radiatus]
MLAHDQTPPPKAVNIIRPSSPLFHYLKKRSSPPLNQQYQYQQIQQIQQQQQQSSQIIGTSHSTSTTSSSSPSTLSTLSGGSGTNGNRVSPTILNSSSFGFSFFQAQQNSTTTTSPPTWFKSNSPIPSQPSSPPRQHYSPQVNNPLPTTGFMNSFSPRFFRVRQSSIDDNNSSFFLRRQSSMSEIQQDDEDSSADEDYDSIDGNTDPEQISDIEDGNDQDEQLDYNEEEDLPIKVVAKVKNGTILNGKGEFVNKGADDRVSWLDEARAGRKIADLEIENSSLLALNSTLEAKVHQQAARIAKLEKQLQMNEWPLSPVSDKDMDEDQPCFEKLISSELLTEDEIANDHVFQKLRSMLLGLIEQAEEAVRQKTKSTGRVLVQYDDEESVQENIITLDAPPTILKPSTRVTPYSNQQRNQLQSSTTQKRRPLRRVSDAQETRKPNSITATTASVAARKRSPMQRSLSRASSPAVLVTTDNNDVSPHQLRPTSPRPFSPPMQRTSTKSRPSHLRKSQDLDTPRWNY